MVQFTTTRRTVPAEAAKRSARSGPREFIDYTTSMTTDSDPLRGLLFY